MEVKLRRKAELNMKTSKPELILNMAIEVSHALKPQDNPRGSRKFNHPHGGKTSRGECFKHK